MLRDLIFQLCRGSGAAGKCPLRGDKQPVGSEGGGTAPAVEAPVPPQVKPPNAEPFAVTGESECDDRRIVERIQKAYALAMSRETVKATDVWQTIFEGRHARLHELLMGGDTQALTQALRRPGDNNFFYGIDNLYHDFAKLLKEDPSYVVGFIALCRASLVRLAELTGAVRLDNPEALQSKPWAAGKSADELLASIENALRIPLSFPNPYPDEYGLATTRGTASYRAIQSIYQASLIRELVHGQTAPRVLELGAGLGRTAYYARQMGVTNYTIVDLPFTSVSQAYFLMRTLGEDQVQLYGEEVADEAARVKIFPPSVFLNGQARYDLILNVDSMPEMDRPTVIKYLEKIRHSTPCFLSINHEANQLSVGELIDQLPGVLRKERHFYGLRAGYAQETVRFS